MFQSSCDHHQGVFLKTSFLKEVAKIYYLYLLWRHVCVCLCAFYYSVDVSTVAGTVSVLTYRVSLIFLIWEPGGSAEHSGCYR